MTALLWIAAALLVLWIVLKVAFKVAGAILWLVLIAAVVLLVLALLF